MSGGINTSYDGMMGRGMMGGYSGFMKKRENLRVM